MRWYDRSSGPRPGGISNCLSSCKSVQFVARPIPNYIGNGLAAGLNYNSAGGAGLFAPNYKTPRALQMNIGIQHEIRRGMVVSADYLRNVETHALLNVDINQVGAARHFNPTQAAAAVNATVAACGASSLQGAITSPAQGGQGCAALNGVDSNNNAIPANITNFTNFGLGSALDTGAASACPTGGCAFSGINPNYGQMSFLEPVSRSVYNALQIKLVQNVANPMRGVKTANFQIAYSLSRFINPMGSQGNAAPSNPVAGSDQDFVLQASDNDNPLKYMGPSLLDRTHQFSFGGSFDVPYGFRFGLIAHFYSPLSSPVIVGDTGSGGQIFQTDFTGSGSWSDPLPGTTNGSFERDFGLNGLNSAITKYNNTQGNQATPAGQVLINSGLFNLSQLQTIGAVAPGNLATAASNQLLFPWLKATDFKLSWKHTFFERLSVEPNVGFYNVFNFANSNLPPGAMTGWLNEGAGSINSIAKGSAGAIPFRVGAGTGVFGLGAPRALEWGLRLTF